MTPSIFLKPGREKSVLNFHPWVFSGAIARVSGSPAAGDEVRVCDYQERFLARGFFNPDSQIRVRLLAFSDTPLDSTFFEKGLRRAISLRDSILSPQTNDCRLIHAEGDGLSGLIVDRYAEVLVAQFNARGMYLRREEIGKILLDITGARHLIDRSDAKALAAEGLSAAAKEPAGDLPQRIEILENGHQFEIDLLHGQKTGFFLDQRDNRRMIGELAGGKKLLNCFAYSGGFSVYAAATGSQTTSVDISKVAVEQARKNFALNGLDPAAHHFEAANVFDYLRHIEGDRYDIIVLDPPAFAQRKGDITKASRAYKDINRIAFQKVRENGLVLSCSCSSFISEDLFRKILFGAAKEAGRLVQILARPAQPPDHPVNIYHPEGEYLKTVLMRVL